MNRLRSLLFLATLGGSLLSLSAKTPQSSPSSSLTRWVNTLIGTDWVGNVYPGASAPFGMVQLSPDNGRPGWDYIAGYFYPDSVLAGFSHTHLSGTGAGDLYDISFFPTLLPPLVEEVRPPLSAGMEPKDQRPLGWHARFSHATEVARAGYYAVTLEPSNIRVELTATPRVGIQRYTFQQASDSACIRLDLDKAMNWDGTRSSDVRFTSSSTLSGYRLSDGWARQQEVYFYTRLSRVPDSVAFERNPRSGVPGKASYGTILKLYYKVRANESITLTTALSGVSEAGAKRNHQAEAPHLDFDRYRRSAEEAWSKRLGQVTLDAKTPDSLRTTFYTALYRSQLCPTIYSDVDGRYLGADRKVHQARHTTYSTFSLWDTYRTAHPLYALLSPSEAKAMVASLVAFGEENAGHLPVWNMFASETDMMIGHHSIPVIVEAVLKGIYVPRDKAKLLRLLRSTAERTGYRGLDSYQRLGYIPAEEEEESVSKTLEYAYDDAAIARYARWMGDEGIARRYEERARSWRNVWDAKTGFFAPRSKNQGFLPDFDPFAYTKHFTESNAYQYLFSVQHDVSGLDALMGGKLGERLDEFFSAATPSRIELPIFSTGMIGQYAHGNEPGHHVIFLYNHARQPWRTAELTHQVLRQLYHDRPDGLCGNEDCGQMSAWYVMASLGLYPVDPLDGKYELVTPLFEEARVQLPGGKLLTIKAPRKRADEQYTESVTFNGKRLNRSYLTYQELKQGGTIHFSLTAERGKIWY